MEVGRKAGTEGKLYPHLILPEAQRKAEWEWMKEVVQRNCLIKPGHPMPGKQLGSLIDWTFYTRRALFSPAFMRKLTRYFLHIVAREIGHFNFQLSGLETAATPILTAIPIIAQEYGVQLNAFVCRKTQKEYALRNWIEGIPNEKPVFLIDDLFSSTSSTRQAMDICVHEDLQILPHAFALINKTNRGAPGPREVFINVSRETGSPHSDLVLPLDIHLHTIFDLDDFELYSPNYPIYTKIFA